MVNECRSTSLAHLARSLYDIPSVDLGISFKTGGASMGHGIVIAVILCYALWLALDA